MEELHGWYSCRQFAVLNSNNKYTKNRHLYYINEKGDSVEVTIVTKSLSPVSYTHLTMPKKA